MTTSADELRTAAEKLRALASKATTGICPDWIYNAVRHVARNCQIECSHDDHQDWEQPEWDRYADSPFISAMHPRVGLALADWLDETARNAEPFGEINTHAVETARAINGTAS
jgi:hypothetical protein